MLAMAGERNAALAEVETLRQVAETREEWCVALEAEVERLRAAAALVSGPGGPGAGGR
jgi:hypothetical protein